MQLPPPLFCVLLPHYLSPLCCCWCERSGSTQPPLDPPPSAAGSHHHRCVLLREAFPSFAAVAARSLSLLTHCSASCLRNSCYRALSADRLSNGVDESRANIAKSMMRLTAISLEIYTQRGINFFMFAIPVAHMPNICTKRVTCQTMFEKLFSKQTLHFGYPRTFSLVPLSFFGEQIIRFPLAPHHFVRAALAPLPSPPNGERWCNQRVARKEGRGAREWNDERSDDEVVVMEICPRPLR